MPVEMYPRQQVKPFLADTHWYSLTQRLSKTELVKLASLRQKQGFNAIQLAVCIPPEVGPLNPNAQSEVGFPWLIKKPLGKEVIEINTNPAYLNLAREKIKMINEQGLGVIVYGAWGHQIEWTGTENMKRWWGELTDTLNDLEVMYSLTGESNISIGSERKLFPDKALGNFASTTARKQIPDPIRYFLSRYIRPQVFDKLVRRNALHARIEEWSEVLDFLAQQTDKPLLLHPAAGYNSHNSVTNPEQLSAVTAYTGHFESAKNSLWKTPKKLRKAHPKVPYINLEPWYEGIKNKFWTEDQLFGFWTSMLSGAAAHCYGAQGVWNVGRTNDNFLNYWGTQTYEEALASKTPQLLGRSFAELQAFLSGEKGQEFNVKTTGNELTEIGMRTKSRKQVIYYPHTQVIQEIQQGDGYWNPLEAEYINPAASSIPNQLVIFRN